MPKSTDSSPVESKARAFAAGSWWRFSRYEIRDGYIRPAPEAQLRRYDPWELWVKTRPEGRRSDNGDLGPTPYRALLQMLDQLEYRQDGASPLDFTPAQVDMLDGPLTEASHQRILDWCVRYGLLGILPHTVLQVTLSPKDGVQLQYVRMGIGWTAIEREERHPSLPIVAPRVVLQPLRGLGIVVEPLSKTWARFFPGVPETERNSFAYPQPLTDPFWKMYAEPVKDFLSGAHALREVLIAIGLQTNQELRAIHEFMTGGWPTVVNGLTAPTGIAAPLRRNGRIGLNWVGGSLLASFAMMLLEDLSSGRALQCPCGQLFVSNAYQARYCSRQCRWRFEQRRFRQTQTSFGKTPS